MDIAGNEEQTKLDVDKKKIVLIKPIKEIGEHEVAIHWDYSSGIKVAVTEEQQCQMK